MGITRKQSGLALVESNNATWLAAMRLEAHRVCKARGRVSMIDLRPYAASLDVEPTSPNCFGAVFRGKQWQAIGWVQSTTASCHGRAVRVWAC